MVPAPFNNTKLVEKRLKLRLDQDQQATLRGAGTYSGVHGSSVHSVGCSGVRVAGGVGRTLEAGEMFVTHNRISNFSLVKRSYVPVRKRNDDFYLSSSVSFLESGLFLFPVNRSYRESPG